MAERIRVVHDGGAIVVTSKDGLPPYDLEVRRQEDAPRTALECGLDIVTACARVASREFVRWSDEQVRVTLSRAREPRAVDSSATDVDGGLAILTSRLGVVRDAVDTMSGADGSGGEQVAGAAGRVLVRAIGGVVTSVAIAEQHYEETPDGQLSHEVTDALASVSPLFRKAAR